MTVQAIEVAATGSPLAVLRMQRSGLPAAEARVADAILDSPQLVTSESIGDLAARAGSATATVIRMCRRVGFDGFYRLKISLAQELGAVRQFGHPVILGGDAPSVLQTAMLADAEEIANAVGLIDPDAFATAVDRLVSAREVLFAGVGTSAPVAQLGALRFLVLGLRATVLVDVQAQDLAARLLPPGSCCVLVSHTGASREIVAISRSARDAGATTIAITSFSRSPLARSCDVVLATGNAKDPRTLELFTTRAVHVSLFGALHVAVAARLADDGVFSAVGEVAGRHLQ